MHAANIYRFSPALFSPVMQAKEDAAHGRTAAAKKKCYIALGLNIAAVVAFVVVIIIVASAVAVASSGVSSYSSHPGY